MCLDRLTDHKPCKTGYKVFYKDGSKIISQVVQDFIERAPNIPVGKWIDEEDYRPSYCSGEAIAGRDFTYPFCFHNFHSLADAKKWKNRTNEVIYKVAVRKPVVTGLQTLGYYFLYRLRKYAKITGSKQIKLIEEV